MVDENKLRTIKSLLVFVFLLFVSFSKNVFRPLRCVDNFLLIAILFHFGLSNLCFFHLVLAIRFPPVGLSDTHFHADDWS